MKLLEERILRDGKVLGDDILKVDMFLNHQIDVTLLNEIGKEFHRLFQSAPIKMCIRDSSHAAAIALGKAGIVTMAHCAILDIACDYSFYGKLAVCIPEWGGVVEDTQFGGAVTVRVRIHATLVDSFCAKLTDASNGRFQAVQTGECFAAAD